MGHSLLARDKLNHMWTKSFNTRTSCIFWQHQHADLCNYLHIFGLSSYDCTPFCSQIGVGLTGQFRDWWAYVEKILAWTVSIRAEFWMVSKLDKNDIMSSMIFFREILLDPVTWVILSTRLYRMLLFIHVLTSTTLNGMAVMSFTIYRICYDWAFLWDILFHHVLTNVIRASLIQVKYDISVPIL